MFGMLVLEEAAKQGHGLTHLGMNGYLITRLTERQLIMDRALYGFSIFDVSAGSRVDPTMVTRYGIE